MTRFTRRLASIAHAPQPPAGKTYLFREDVKRSALASVHSSPYLPGLSYLYDENTRSIYVHPVIPPPLPPDSVPVQYQPDPAFQPEPVPIPVRTEKDVPLRNGDYLQAEASSPTGRWLLLPRPTTNVAYYRTRYPHASFCERGDEVYVRFAGSRDRTLPESSYVRVPPSDNRVQAFTGPRNAETVHVYLFPWVKDRQIHMPLRDRIRKDSSTLRRKYVPVATDALSDPQVAAMIAQCAQRLIVNADAETPPTQPRYFPLPIHTAELTA